MPASNSRDVSPQKRPASVLDTASFSQEQIRTLFTEALELENSFLNTSVARSRHRVIAFLFFEPSTRTRMSFQMAAERLGYSVITLESASSSSLSKGETLEDTVLNVLAMKPDALVIRYGEDAALDQLLPKLELPVFIAGAGTKSHPTQALLDALTIHRELGSVEGKKVLIVGDVRHSRVASSNFDVLTKLGAEVAICGPRDMLPPKDSPAMNFKTFENLDEACAWCDVYMGLRVQRERHEGRADLGSYNAQFGLNQARLQKLKKNAIIMHPGPINHGVEFSHDVMNDPRNRVLQQVSNGVLIRAALLKRALGTVTHSGDPQ